jgi:hypothetical protein
MLKPILSTHHSDPRDSNIVFFEEGHKYTILSDPDSKYTSVTTWNHHHFPKFDADQVIQNMMKGKNWGPSNKYWGKTPEQIKAQWSANGQEVSGAGTNMHYQIECFMNNPDLTKGYTHKDLLEHYYLNIKDRVETDTPEWTYFLEFVKATPELKPYRTEWLIYDEEIKLAGSIDMVYENPDGTLMIYDWKRSKDITKTNGWNKSAITECIQHLPDTNFWHYSLQLNTYKTILETKYGKKVTQLYLVKLHPLNPKKSYELLKVPFLDEEMKDLTEYRKSLLSINT